MTLSTTEAALEGWLRLASSIAQEVLSFAGSAKVSTAAPAELAALALLARSHRHLEAISILLRSGFIVEARILARSVLENTMLAVAFSVDPQATAELLRDDHHASRGKGIKNILRVGEHFEIEQLEELKRILPTLDKGSYLQPKKLAEKFDLLEYYVFYAALSNDSAHPSFDALEKHLVLDANEELDHFAWATRFNAEDACDTIAWACMGMLRLLEAVGKTTGRSDRAQALADLSDQYRALVKTIGQETQIQA